MADGTDNRRTKNQNEAVEDLLATYAYQKGKVENSNEVLLLDSMVLAFLLIAICDQHAEMSASRKMLDKAEMFEESLREHGIACIHPEKKVLSGKTITFEGFCVADANDKCDGDFRPRVPVHMACILNYHEVVVRAESSDANEVNLEHDLIVRAGQPNDMYSLVGIYFDSLARKDREELIDKLSRPVASPPVVESSSDPYYVWLTRLANRRSLLNENQKEELIHQKAVVTQQNAELEKQVAELKAENSKNDKAVHMLTQQKDATIELNADLQAKNAELQSKYAALEAALADLKLPDGVSCLLQKNERLGKKVEELKTKVEEFETKDKERKNYDARYKREMRARQKAKKIAEEKNEKIPAKQVVVTHSTSVVTTGQAKENIMSNDNLPSRSGVNEDDVEKGGSTAGTKKATPHHSRQDAAIISSTRPTADMSVDVLQPSLLQGSTTHVPPHCPGGARTRSVELEVAVEVDNGLFRQEHPFSSSSSSSLQRTTTIAPLPANPDDSRRDDGRCIGETAGGDRCRFAAQPGSRYCRFHNPEDRARRARERARAREAAEE